MEEGGWRGGNEGDLMHRVGSRDQYLELLVVSHSAVQGTDTIIITTHHQTWCHGNQLLITSCMVPGSNTCRSREEL